MIYLVEDDENLNSILRVYLEKEGFKVKSFNSGLSAKEMIQKEPTLWILDIGLPDIDGYTLLKEIKTHNPTTPVIFISARDRDIDRLMGLEIGANDYITKPFLPRELIIRVKNLFDRKLPKEISGIKLDTSSRKLYQEGEEISLTSKEYDMIEYFFKNKNIALSREQILDALWEGFGSDRAVDDLVRRIRKKVPSLPLETLYGYGYRLNS